MPQVEDLEALMESLDLEPEERATICKYLRSLREREEISHSTTTTATISFPDCATNTIDGYTFSLPASRLELGLDDYKARVERIRRRDERRKWRR